jgi:predicted ATP-dependent serine protease
VALVERDHELAALERLLADARSGTGSVLLLEGSAGIGKTSLLAAAREHAAESGMRVLQGRGTEQAGDRPAVRGRTGPHLARRGRPARRALDVPR